MEEHHRLTESIIHSASHIAMLQTKVDELTAQLERLLSTQTPEFPTDEMFSDGIQETGNWQAFKARDVSRRLLRVTKCDGFGGCPLCRS